MLPCAHIIAAASTCTWGGKLPREPPLINDANATRVPLSAAVTDVSANAAIILTPGPGPGTSNWRRHAAACSMGRVTCSASAHSLSSRAEIQPWTGLKSARRPRLQAASDPASATMSAELFLASLRHMHPPPEPAAGSLQRPQHRARIKRVVDSQLATMALVMKELGGAPA